MNRLIIATLSSQQPPSLYSASIDQKSHGFKVYIRSSAGSPRRWFIHQHNAMTNQTTGCIKDLFLFYAILSPPPVSGRWVADGHLNYAHQEATKKIVSQRMNMRWRRTSNICDNESSSFIGGDIDQKFIGEISAKSRTPREKEDRKVYSEKQKGTWAETDRDRKRE